MGEAHDLYAAGACVAGAEEYVLYGVAGVSELRDEGICQGLSAVRIMRRRRWRGRRCAVSAC